MQVGLVRSDRIQAFTDDYSSIEQPAGTTSQAANKRRGSVAADFAPHRLIVSERQQMAVLKQLTAGEESNSTLAARCRSTLRFLFVQRDLNRLHRSLLHRVHRRSTDGMNTEKQLCILLLAKAIWNNWKKCWKQERMSMRPTMLVWDARILIAMLIHLQFSRLDTSTWR